MAARTDDKPRRSRSTGAAKFDPGPAEATQVADNASTGAVQTDGPTYEKPAEHTVDHLDQDVVVVSPTPGPVTVALSWLSDDDDVEQKVVTAPEKGDPKTSDADVSTKG